MKVQNYNSTFASSTTWRALLTTIPTIAMLLVGTMASPRAHADATVHPAACVAPFLDQAFPMRWHEHFLMNPATSQTTFVICPIEFNWTVAHPSIFARVSGARMDGASADTPLCFLTVVDRTNLSLGEYINIQNKTFTVAMTTTPTFPTWTAQSPNVPFAAITAAGVSGSFADWAIATFCRLPPGFAISQIFVND